MDHDARYARTAEFLDILHRLFREPDPIDHVGQYFECRQTRLDYGLCGSPDGRIYFGGFSEPARDLAAKAADVYLLWGVPVDEVAATVADLNRRAATYGRTLRFGLRINVVGRPTADQAWEHIRRMEASTPDTVVTAIRSTQQETDSIGQRHMFQLAAEGGRQRGAYWTGLGRLRVGSGTALVGSYRDVADFLRRYQDAGIDVFILAATPHLEECLRVGEQVLPLCWNAEDCRRENAINQ